MIKLIWILAGFLVAAGTAQAENLVQSGNWRWLALASSKDKDQAIGIARRINFDRGAVKVVSSKSGFYGVIAGPYAASSIQQLKKGDVQSVFTDLPKDALMSRGDNYIKTVWDAKSQNTVITQPYVIDKPVEFSMGSFSAKVQGQKIGTDRAYTSIDGKDGQGTFHFDIGKDVPDDEKALAEEFLNENFNQAAVVKLLSDSEAQQLLITNYSGGAHCCTTSYFASRPKGAASWTLIKGATLDGGGYGFEDVDGDGTMELISVDNAFLYAFDSYAGSVAPLRISKLREGKIEDVSEEPAFRGRIVQDLAGIEWDAKIDPQQWGYNGFLVGWLASKIRLGQGDEAWAKFIKNYQGENGFGPQTCTTGQKIDDCAAENMKPVPIPKAVAGFLRDAGYAPLPAEARKLLD